MAIDWDGLETFGHEIQLDRILPTYLLDSGWKREKNVIRKQETILSLI